MKDFWNNRYSSIVYAYGTEPNEFFKETLERYALKGKVLMAAEGEGRNAVYAAQQGLDVVAFDTSEEGRKKALLLAKKVGVKIQYQVGNLEELPLLNEKFNAAVLIFAHFPPHLSSTYHRQIGELIQSGGYLILEGFSKSHLPLRQANPGVGGPNNIDMLFSERTIREDFPNFEIITLEEKEVKLSEGLFHNGRGKVIRFIGRKMGSEVSHT